MIRIAGLAASPGVAAGPAVVFTYRTSVVRFPIPAARVEDEIVRLESARTVSQDQLRAIQRQLASGPGQQLVSLFEAQILMLDDALWRERTDALIRSQHVNAEWAVQQVFEQFFDAFQGVADPYLRERGGDFHDVLGRIRMNLRSTTAGLGEVIHALDQACILVADELPPSLAAQLDWSRVQAIATDAGGRTYHTAILARSLHVPAVVGLRDFSRRVNPGSHVVVDGDAGVVLLDAPADVRPRSSRRGSEPADEEAGPPGITATTDGVVVRLDATLERSTDVARALAAGAEGVGLYRSESLLAERSGELSEDDQYVAYRRLVEGMAPRPVTVRTFDLDDDQLRRRERLPWPGEPWPGPEAPLGVRGVRLSERDWTRLDTQLRALVRASRHGALQVLFPFVSGLEELQAAKARLRQACTDVAGAGPPVDPPPAGAMVEIPSAALTVDLLATEADFVAVGTNDLIQYCLAVDRADPRVSHLYRPLHPAVVRLLRHVQRLAGRSGCPVSVCGEAANDPVMLALLVGLGFRAFSVPVSMLAVARQALRRIEARGLRAAARAALRQTGPDGVRDTIARALADHPVTPRAGRDC